jgi:16S rRNA (adenine1518-N6/adenine1519-N6)-dimethyltransferase
MTRDLLSETQYLLKVNKIKPGYVAGQNFLICNDVLQSIVAAADIKPSDCILEVGPGLGVMTGELVKQAKKVLAIEYDNQLIPLITKLVDVNDNLELINEDILRVKNDEIVARLGKKYRVVANIPYQITSKIIKKFLTFEPKPDSLVLLVQKEVAERIVAKPGQLSKLAISVQFYSQPEIIRIVPHECFWPEPKVNSAIIKFTLHNKYLKKIKDVKLEEKKFWSVVRGGFVGKRKTLANNLSSSLHMTRDDAIAILESIGIDKNSRAQELSIDQWIDLALKI